MSVSRLFGERMGKRGGHHLPILRNESNRAGRGARWRHVVWWELRKPECVGMYGDSAIAAAGVRRQRTTAACRPGRQLVREQLERVGQFQRPRRQQFGRHDDIVRRIHWPLLLGCVDVKPLPNDPRRAAAILDRLDSAKDQFGVRLAEAEGTHDKRAIRWNATRL
jgi:hypothetical protein